MKVIVPSYKRAGLTTTDRLLGGDCALAVHEFEAEAYERAGARVMVVPDAARGNIARVRNWILDHADDDEIVMLDDDLKEVGYFGKPAKHNAMSAGEILRLLRRGFVLARDWGATLWGVNLQNDPKFYRTWTPFSTLLPVLGTFSCHVAPTLRYDETLSLNEDYDFFLKTIRERRVVVRMNKYYYLADHVNKRGGCSTYRTVEREREQAEIMRRRWGSDVVRYDFSKSFNPVIHVPISGV